MKISRQSADRAQELFDEENPRTPPSNKRRALGDGDLVMAVPTGSAANPWEVAGWRVDRDFVRRLTRFLNDLGVEIGAPRGSSGMQFVLGKLAVELRPHSIHTSEGDAIVRLTETVVDFCLDHVERPAAILLQQPDGPVGGSFVPASTDAPIVATPVSADAHLKSGRPASFSQEQLTRALELKLAGKSNQETARSLYGVVTPSDNQRRGVSTILKHHFPDRFPPHKK